MIIVKKTYELKQGDELFNEGVIESLCFSTEKELKNEILIKLKNNRQFWCLKNTEHQIIIRDK